MPVVKDKIEFPVEIEFEVVCDDCETGLCSSTRMERNVAYVSACPKCMAQKDYEINDLKKTIERLEEKIYELETRE